jgi:hypothetical protein
MGINGAWWSAWRGDQGACYCGEGHEDHLKSVDWKRGRGLADGYLRAANRWQSWMYGLKTGGAEWLEAGQAKVNGYSGVRRANAKIDHGSR